jgi:hypothetical protein
MPFKFRTWVLSRSMGAAIVSTMRKPLTIPQTRDGRRAYSAALLLAVTACAHGWNDAERTIHQRAFAGTEGNRGVVAELLDTPGSPPSLRLTTVDRCGAVPPRATGEQAQLEASVAAEVAARVEGGMPLEAALPRKAGVEAPDWQGALSLEGSLRGYALRMAQMSDRYGEHRLVELVDPAGAHTELFRAHPGASIRLASIQDGAVLARIDGPGSVRDLRLLDPAAGARALRVAAGEAHLAAGDAAAALAEADAAAAFDAEACKPDGSLPWLRTRALAAQHASTVEVLEALERAIAVDASRYRMYARMAPELAPLRGDPRFDELVRPRRLPGAR